MAAPDRFASYDPGVIGRPTRFHTVVAFDVDLPFFPRAFMVGTSGAVVIKTRAGTNVTLPSVAAGVWHPGGFDQIISSGTTAITIVIAD